MIRFCLDRDRSKSLREKFNIEHIPALVMLSSTCKVDIWDGIDLVRGAYHKAVRQWCKGKRLFWSREAREGEYVWDGIICHQCYMSPIIGSRYGCTDEKCYVDYCETCFPKVEHEHPLVEYLAPKRQYSLEELFRSVPHLLNPHSEEKIEIKTLWKNGVKGVAFYFSAHWCGPCRAFTRKLAEIYKEAQASGLSFRIVFVSSNFDEQSFNEYRSEMPWPAVPLKSGHLLETYFRSSCKRLFDFLILYNNYCFLLFQKIFQDYSLFHQMEKFYHAVVLKMSHVKE